MSIRVKAGRDAPRVSRARIAEMRSLLEPRFDDVLLAVSELVSNSVRHAGSGDEEIRVLVQATDDQIRIEVTDPGPCFDTDTVSGEGMGLRIVDRLAEAWGVNGEAPCTVWVELAKATEGVNEDRAARPSRRS